MDSDDLTHTVIGCAFKIHNALGSGFLESVYENALRIEMERADIAVMQQEKVQVWYEGQVVGDYYTDLCIPGLLIIEIKAVQTLAKQHEVQLVNYLTATRIDNGLLTNFGPSVQVKRKYSRIQATHVIDSVYSVTTSGGIAVMDVRLDFQNVSYVVLSCDRSKKSLKLRV
jgi:GxxExxY protein